MKKLLALVISVLLSVSCLFALTGCGKDKNEYTGIQKVAYSDMKVGLICLHDENSGYDNNFIEAFKAACTAKGIPASNVFIKTNISESVAAYEAACDLVDLGCNYIAADSFGHEEHILKAAKEFPNVQFSHATGVTAAATQRGNFHNAFANIFEGRYLAGVAAGVKLVSMYNADNSIAVENAIKVGYVGAFTYAEVISGYTSWFLGCRNTVEEMLHGITVKMDVTFTGSWYDETAESNGATALINAGAKLVSQHADSMGAPNACQTATVPNVSYNGTNTTSTFVISSRINWQPYYEYCLESLNNGTEIAYDWTAGFGNTWFDGSACLTTVGPAAAEGTDAKINAELAKIKNGSLKVFDCSKFTVDGRTITSADNSLVKTVGTITYFDESSNISAPSFDLKIDGITLLNTKF